MALRVNTPTHALLSLLLLGTRVNRAGALALVVGGIAPDIPMFLLYAWATWVASLPGSVIWSETYYEPGWQAAVDAAHSVPIALAFVAMGLARTRTVPTLRPPQHPLTLFGASLILHSAFDLPVHHDDGHRHFWPLSNWRFDSPISYWDPCCQGPTVALLEVTAMLGAVFVLWRRMRGGLTRWTLGVLGLVYGAGLVVLVRQSADFPWLAALLGGSP